MFRSSFPIISTPDMNRALRFYRDVLGGKVTYQFPDEGEPGYVAIDIGESHLGLGFDPSASDTPDQSSRFALWVYAEDCDAAVDQLRAGGALIVEEPTDQPWGERVARVRDPDGNLIIVGAPAQQ